MKGGGGSGGNIKSLIGGSGIVTQPIFAGIVPVNSNFQRNSFPTQVRGTHDLRTVACYGAFSWEIHWHTLIIVSQPIRDPNNKPIYYPGGRFWKKMSTINLSYTRRCHCLAAGCRFLCEEPLPHEGILLKFWLVFGWDLSLERLINLTLELPWVTKTEFLLTISIQYQVDRWWELRKILFRGLLVDPIPDSPN